MILTIDLNTSQTERLQNVLKITLGKDDITLEDANALNKRLLKEYVIMIEARELEKNKPVPEDF